MRSQQPQYYSDGMKEAQQKNRSNWPDSPMSEAQLLAILHAREQELVQTKQQLMQTQQKLLAREQELAQARQSTDSCRTSDRRTDYEFEIKELRSAQSQLLRRCREEQERNQEMVMEMEKWKSKCMQYETRTVRSNSVKKSIPKDSGRESMTRESIVENVRIEFGGREKMEMQERIKELKKQLDDREKELKKLNNYCEQAEIGLKKESNRAACYEETVTSYEQKIALLSHQTWRLNEMINRLRRELGDRNARIGEFESLQSQLESENEKLQRITEMIESRGEDIEHMKKNIEVYASVQERNNQVMEEMGVLQNAYNKKIQQCQQMHEHICTLSEQIMGLEQTILSLRFDMRDEQGKHKEMCKAIEIDKEHMRMSYEALLQSKDREQTEALRQILHCKDKLDKIQRKHDKINQRIESLQQLVKSLREDYIDRLEEIKQKDNKQHQLMNKYSNMEIVVHNLVQKFTQTKELQRAFIKSLKFCKMEEDTETDTFDHREIQNARNFMKEPLFTANNHDSTYSVRKQSIQRSPIEVKASKEANRMIEQRQFYNNESNNSYGSNKNINVYNVQYGNQNNRNEVYNMNQGEAINQLKYNPQPLRYNNNGYVAGEQFLPVSQKAINLSPQQMNNLYHKSMIHSPNHINKIPTPRINNFNTPPMQRILISERSPPSDYNERRSYEHPNPYEPKVFIERQVMESNEQFGGMQQPFPNGDDRRGQQRLFPIKKTQGASSFRKDNSMGRESNSISERNNLQGNQQKSRSPFGLSVKQKNY